MSKQYLFRIEIKNKKDSSPLHIVAYYSGHTQLNAFNKERFPPSTKKQVLYSNLSVPQNEYYEDLPDYLQINGKRRDIIDNARNIMWKNIDLFEKRIDSQFARLFEMSTPYFLTIDETKKLVNQYAKELTDFGMVCDVAIHKTNTAENTIFNMDNTPKYDELQDYGCFFLCTLRPFKDGILQNKNRDWNTAEQLVSWRKRWVEMLAQAIHKNATDEPTKAQWLNRLNIYPEYNKKFKINR